MTLKRMGEWCRTSSWSDMGGSPVETPTYGFVESEVRKMTFGVYTTIDDRGRPHSTGILYGVAPQGSPMALYMLTLEHYAKVRNVTANPWSTLAVPFPHRILSFIPSSCVTFRGRSEVIPFDDPDGQWAFAQQRILRDNLAWLSHSDPVFLRLMPDPKVICYGLGYSVFQIRRQHTACGYSVTIDR